MTATVLVAADPPTVPAGAGEPPGQPYVSPDDLASIQPLWAEAVDEHLMPVVAEMWNDSAGQVHAEMVDAVGVELPSVSSLAAEQYLQQASNTFAEVGNDLWETARAELLAGFQAGESIDQLAARLRGSAGLTAKKAVLVARTQILDASNAGSIATIRASGLDMLKGWLATPDMRTRPTHVTAGHTYDEGGLVGLIPLAEKFVVGGFEADRPHDPVLPPAERYSCRCTLAYGLPDEAVAQAREQATPPAALPNTSGVMSIEDRVRATYRGLAKKDGDLVSLALLRDRLPDIARPELDQALKAMDRRREIQLDPDPNRKALPAEAHAAAIRIGGEDKHLLSLLVNETVSPLGVQGKLPMPAAVDLGGEARNLIKIDRPTVVPAPETGIPGVDYTDPALLESPHAVDIADAIESGMSPQEIIDIYVNDDGFSEDIATLLVNETVAALRAQGRMPLPKITKREAARARQKVIDQAEPVANFAAEVDNAAYARQVLPFDAETEKIFTQRIVHAEASGIPEEELAGIRAAVRARDLRRIREEAQRLQDKYQLEAIGKAGDLVSFDPATMRGVADGTDIAEGQLVTVIRQGHRVTVKGEVVQLDRAVVSPSAAAPATTVASGRERWSGCRFCLNPRHPGPCAKPGTKAYERRHGKAGAAKGGGGGGPGSGKDLIGDGGDADTVSTSINDAVAAAPQVRGDNVLGQISARQGFDGKPEVVSQAEFEQRIQQPGHVEMHRGINNGTEVGIRGNDRPPAALAEDFRSGDMYQGFGMYGNGTYTAAGPRAAATATKYAGQNGVVLRMALKPGARTIEYHTAVAEHDAFRASHRTPPVRQAFSNVSHYAAARGYDAMVQHVAGDQDHYVIFNRTALVVQEA